MLNKTLISGDSRLDVDVCQQQLDTSDHIRGTEHGGTRMKDQGDTASVIAAIAKKKRKGGKKAK